MLKRQDEHQTKVCIVFEGERLDVAEGETVIAAVMASGVEYNRTTPVHGKHRAGYCQMGVCFDCLMEIDGVPNQQACMIQVRDGMIVNRQEGARELNDE